MKLKLLQDLPGTYHNDIYLIKRIVYDGYGTQSTMVMIITDINKPTSPELTNALDLINQIIDDPEYKLVFQRLEGKNAELESFEDDSDNKVVSPILPKDSLLHSVFTINPRYITEEMMYEQLYPLITEMGVGLRNGEMADQHPSSAWC